MRLDVLLRALTRNRAETDRESEDPALRGRTYAVPFDRVWRAALELADGGLRGWTLVRADDGAGVLEAEAQTRVFRFVDDIRVAVGLDAEGQTRVDMSSASRKGKADLGTNRRRIRRFMAALDDRVAAAPEPVRAESPSA